MALISGIAATHAAVVRRAALDGCQYATWLVIPMMRPGKIGAHTSIPVECPWWGDRTDPLRHDVLRGTWRFPWRDERHPVFVLAKGEYDRVLAPHLIVWVREAIT